MSELNDSTPLDKLLQQYYQQNAKGGLVLDDMNRLKTVFQDNKISYEQAQDWTREEFINLKIPIVGGILDRFTKSREVFKTKEYEEKVNIQKENHTGMNVADNLISENEERDTKERLRDDKKILNRRASSSEITKIIAIGNPGAGKSTVLNSLAQEHLFDSGISIGQGLTDNLYKKKVGNVEYHDTPGIADDTFRKIAGAALSNVFSNGGRMKLIFFVTQQTGRLRAEDSASMKLILDSVPEIKNHYGIIVNKIPDEVYKEFEDEEKIEEFMAKVFYGMDDSSKHSNILFVRRNKELACAKNIVLETDYIHEELEEFIEKLPFAYLTPNPGLNIPVDRFEEIMEKVEKMKREITENNVDFEYEKAKLQQILRDATQQDQETNSETSPYKNIKDSVIRIGSKKYRKGGNKK